MLNKIKNFFIGFFSVLWISMIALLLASPSDIGGTEINGFLAFALWVLFIYFVIKKYAIVSCIVSTTLFIIIKVNKYGVGDLSAVSDVLIQAILGGVFIFALYKMFFGNKQKATDKTEHQSRKIQKREIDTDYYTDQYDDSYYRSSERVENTAPRLVSGSKEYWEYKEAAEAIYRDFCGSNSITERRNHKQRGERLKERLLSEYGAKDECVRSIIDNYLDLRV